MGIHISPSPIQQQKFPCKVYFKLSMKIYINDLHRQLIYGVKKAYRKSNRYESAG